MTQDTEDVVARLRLIAKQHSETSRMMAQSKSLRQAHTPPRDDLYMWATPEQTTEWKAADLIQSLSDRIDVLEGLLDEAESWLSINSVVNHDDLCAKIRAALHQEGIATGSESTAR